MRTNSNLAVKLPRQEEQVRQPEIVKSTQSQTGFQTNESG